MDVSIADEVNGDIKRPGLLDDCGDIRIDILLIKGVDDGGVRDTTLRANLGGERFELRLGATGEEDPGTFEGKGTGLVHSRLDRPRRRSRQPYCLATSPSHPFYARPFSDFTWLSHLLSNQRTAIRHFWARTVTSPADPFRLSLRQTHQNDDRNRRTSYPDEIRGRSSTPSLYR